MRKGVVVSERIVTLSSQNALLQKHFTNFSKMKNLTQNTPPPISTIFIPVNSISLQHRSTS
jgi:hypothetical protein